MKAHLKILILFRVCSVLVKSGNVFEGTVGQTVVIRCPFPNKHKYTPKYFCRHPCSLSKHVLLKTEEIDEVVSADRYSVMSTSSTRIFTVTIRHLTLKDSGFYYCGLDQWFRDTLKKVQLIVHPAPVTPHIHVTHTSAAVLNSTNILNHTVVSTTHTYTDDSSPPPTVQFTNSSQMPDKSSAAEVSLGYASILLVLCALVALVLLYKRRLMSKSSALKHPTPDNAVLDTPDLNQNIEDIYHLYDELGQPLADDSSVIYSTVQNCDPASQDDVNVLYSHITHKCKMRINN
nr:CMRF35-like molecule 3 [Misgurnus anguillicaudatus]XP_055024608.1 CMRF35-like molecule 3 [Misgurnus anguillicaudatus]